jgi:transcriptional regulator with XRE-family HTH domain
LPGAVPTDAPSGAGDLGRRIVARQNELDLTNAQVAGRAGMAVDYLGYLQQTATANPSPAALARLSAALDMPYHELLGGQQLRAEGHDYPAKTPELIDLSLDECQELLGGGGIGRIIFRTDAKLVALPVNFRVLDGDVVFRSEEDGSVSELGLEEPVSFEADRIDDAMREGWSVLASGTVHRADDPGELRQVEALGVEPWAGGERNEYFRLAVTELTGKRIDAVR